VTRIAAPSWEAALFQLGAAHATDRPAQLALMRIVATGRATECVADEPDLLEMDRYFRWLGLYRGASEQAAELRARERAAVDAYCLGLNESMARRPRALPFRVWGYT
jgi:acyl-homoserine lactone acylase PvdQ